MNYIETIRIDNNKAQNIGYHTARMSQNTMITLPSLERLNPHKTGRVKCRIVYNSAEIISTEFTPYTLPIINSLKIVEAPEIVYDKKYLDRSALNELYSKRGDLDDILICKDGLITDSYFCNVIFQKGEKLYTPTSSLLAGTKRQSLIDNKIITPHKISCDDITSYDAVYLVNAMIDLSDNIKISTSKIF